MEVNKEVIEGGWLQIKGQLREGWGFLVRDGSVVVRGRREQFDGRVLARKGLRESESQRGMSLGGGRGVESSAKKLPGDSDRPRG